ncbi:YihY/virulence factor BrkB family protein [Marinobacteraceae bacterium S3BR75-40.1]
MASRQIKDRAHQFQDWILKNPDQPMGRLWRLLHRVARIGYAVGRDLLNGTLTLHAMSLVYTTLLSMVPLLALSFSVLKAMGVHERLEPLLYQFFDPLGTRGHELAQQILDFVDNIKVGVLGSMGLALLVYTVISLVQKIERSFNMIWHVPDMRSLAQRFSNYLSVIMIGPLLMVSAIGVSATVFSSEIVQALLAIEPFGSVFVLLSRMTPFFLVVGAFTFVYVFIPNTRVRLRSAFFGGLLAGVAWQAGGVLFASFVVGSTKYEAIYSSFAIGIILLIWLYISWLVLLVGAAISYYHQHENSIARRWQVRSSPQLEEHLALTIVWRVAKAFEFRQPPPQQEAMEASLPVPGELSRRISDKLLRQHILVLAGENGDCLLPGRPLDQISVSDVLQATRVDEEGLVQRLPAWPGPDLVTASGDQLDVSLQSLLRQPGAEAAYPAGLNAISTSPEAAPEWAGNARD